MTEADELLLQAYLDGELPPAEAERVRIRIANSPEWRRAEGEMLAMLDACASAFDVVDDGHPLRSAAEPAADMAHSRAEAQRSGGRLWLRAAAVAALMMGGSLGIRALLHERDAGERGPASHPVVVAAPEPTALPPGTGPVVAPPAAQGAVEGARPSLPVRDRTAPPADAALTIAGLTPMRISADTVGDVIVERREFNVESGAVVALEVTAAEETAATRGGGPGARARLDTAAVARPAPGGETTLSWYDARTGRVARLRGALSEAELRRLRERVVPARP